MVSTLGDLVAVYLLYQRVQAPWVGRSIPTSWHLAVCDQWWSDAVCRNLITSHQSRSNSVRNNDSIWAFESRARAPTNTTYAFFFSFILPFLLACCFHRRQSTKTGLGLEGIGHRSWRASKKRSPWEVAKDLMIFFISFNSWPVDQWHPPLRLCWRWIPSGPSGQKVMFFLLGKKRGWFCHAATAAAVEAHFRSWCWAQGADFLWFFGISKGIPKGADFWW